MRGLQRNGLKTGGLGEGSAEERPEKGGLGEGSLRNGLKTGGLGEGSAEERPEKRRIR